MPLFYFRLRFLHYPLLLPLSELLLSFFALIESQNAGKMQRAMASIWCCGMVVLLISFFLRPKESLHPVCQLQVTGHIATVNPSEALRLPPYSFKFRYKIPHPLPFRSGWTKGSKHRECGHTPIKSPFSVCCRNGDFFLLGVSQTLSWLLR